MHIGWIIPTVGCFGAVREMVEVSNVLVDRGHRVTIYHPDGGPVTWLPYRGEVAALRRVRHERHDAMIGIVDWQPKLYQVLRKSRAAVKAVCLMGIGATPELAAILRGEVRSREPAHEVLRHSIYAEDIHVLADGGWQIEWMHHHVGGGPYGPAFGGINREMFSPPALGYHGCNRPLVIGASGDPRPRKGSDVVQQALARVADVFPDAQQTTYWAKGYTQEGLVSWYRNCDIFVDGHRRGGWCNPVVEAMACGCAVVCTGIGATQAVAEDDVTARVVPVDDVEAMADAVSWLLRDTDRIGRLRAAALERVAQYDYREVVPQLEAYLETHRCITSPS